VTCSPTRTSPPPCPCFVEQRRSAARTVRTGSAIGDDRPRRMPLRPPRRSAGGAPSLMWIRGPRAWLSRYAGPPPTTTAAYISLRFHHPAPSETSTARNPVGVSLRHAALGAEPFVCDTRRPLRVLQGFQRVIHRRRGRHRRDIGREAGGDLDPIVAGAENQWLAQDPETIVAGEDLLTDHPLGAVDPVEVLGFRDDRGGQHRPSSRLHTRPRPRRAMQAPAIGCNAR